MAYTRRPSASVNHQGYFGRGSVAPSFWLAQKALLCHHVARTALCRRFIDGCGRKNPLWGKRDEKTNNLRGRSGVCVGWRSTRAGSRHRTFRKSRYGRHHEDSRCPCRKCWAVRLLSQCVVCGLEYDRARNARGHAICGCSAIASREDPGRRAAAAHVFRGLGDERAISSERRRLSGFFEGHWRRRMVSALSL